MDESHFRRVKMSVERINEIRRILAGDDMLTPGDRQALESELSELKASAQQTAIEEKVHSEGIPFAVDGVDFSDLDAETITLINAVVKADRRRIYGEHAIELEQIENAAEERELQLKRQNEELQRFSKEQSELIEALRASNANLVGDIGILTDKLSLLKLDNEDLQSKLSNASAQLEEKNTEITRLQSEVADYQKAKVFGEREAQGIIDVTPSEKDEIAAALEALKKKRYVSRENWGPVDKLTLPDGSFEVVKRAEVDEHYEPIAPPALFDDGGSNDGATFLGSDQAETDDREGASEASEAVSQFQETDTAAGLDANAALRTRDGKAPSIEERITMLEQSNLSMQTWIDSIEKRVGKLDGQDQMYNGDEDEAA